MQDPELSSFTAAEGSTHKFSRRTLLKAGGAMGAATGLLTALDTVAWKPLRQSAGAAPAPGDIQHDIGPFIAPAFSINGIQIQFGPIFTTFATATLSRLPTKAEQTRFTAALATIEQQYPWGPAGIMTFVSYGLPYFRRLPGGVNNGSLAFTNIPKLINATNRLALEEAVPGPTDFGQPGITKRKFAIPVRIESNDMLFTLRSDTAANISDVLAWLNGSNRLRGQNIASPGLPLTFTSTRVMFQQRGMIRQVASQAGLYYTDRIQDQSPMWMGFFDQQSDSSGPPAITTFLGNSSAKLTNATAGSYFDNGSMQHLSHVALDLEAYYAKEGEADTEEAEVYSERLQYMFRSNPPPPGVTHGGDPFSNGGGESLVRNEFRGPNDIMGAVQGINTPDNAHRIGHEQALQRSSRAADGTPIHIRMDGAGFDTMDIPANIPRPGTGNVPKLQFTIFVPTSDFFANLRRNAASLDLANQFAVDDAENGLERFSSATRRQNFLSPPRRHRAFPLLELT
ncbi:MAG: hypothetical protein V7637_214 [Mycobacteriales bacterium]